MELKIKILLLRNRAVPSRVCARCIACLLIQGRDVLCCVNESPHISGSDPLFSPGAVLRAAGHTGASVYAVDQLVSILFTFCYYIY